MTNLSSTMKIIPVQPQLDQHAAQSLAGGTGRLTGNRLASRRTFGRNLPSRRTFGKNLPSRRAF